ncbi:hypothetical protein TSAR_002057, partial [Trichomalopsis sarcophagae]
MRESSDETIMAALSRASLIAGQLLRATAGRSKVLFRRHRVARVAQTASPPMLTDARILHVAAAAAAAIAASVLALYRDLESCAKKQIHRLDIPRSGKGIYKIFAEASVYQRRSILKIRLTACDPVVRLG